MKNCQLLLIFLATFSACQQNQQTAQKKTTTALTERTVVDHTIISPAIPKIKIRVADDLQYLGKFDFDIIANSDEYPLEMIGKVVASGERMVFAVVDEDQAVEKLFIVQFEGFLSSNDFIYNYDFSQADFMGNNKYRHNTWYYDAMQSARENPQGEGAKTHFFLAQKGLRVADHWMMSRFVGLASADRKNEIIIFYQEMLEKSTGYTLEEWEYTLAKEEKLIIDSAFVERSKSSFMIIEE